jgi:hypothetical protein
MTETEHRQMLLTHIKALSARLMKAEPIIFDIALRSEPDDPIARAAQAYIEMFHGRAAANSQ